MDLLGKEKDIENKLIIQDELILINFRQKVKLLSLIINPLNLIATTVEFSSF